MPAAPVRAIIGQIMTSTDVFVAGPPQYDDMTLIVLRV
jgi:serine phosphatase RsbU (regulator of sigma subunit)